MTIEFTAYLEDGEHVTGRDQELFGFSFKTFGLPWFCLVLPLLCLHIKYTNMKALTEWRENTCLTGWCWFAYTESVHFDKTLSLFILFHSLISLKYIGNIVKISPRSFTGKKRHSDARRQGALSSGAEVKILHCHWEDEPGIVWLEHAC